MKHIKVFEDYTNDRGSTVHTTSGPDNTAYLTMKMSKMQDFLDKKGVKYDRYKVMYDDVQKLYAKYLKEHPTETGVWGEDASSPAMKNI